MRVSPTPARQLLLEAVALAEAVSSQLPALVRPRPEPPPGPSSPRRAPCPCPYGATVPDTCSLSPGGTAASAGGAAHLFGEFHHLGRVDVVGVGGARECLVRECEADRGQVSRAPGRLPALLAVHQ
jgi:hypothetical protein